MQNLASQKIMETWHGTKHDKTQSLENTLVGRVEHFMAILVGLVKQ
jgi:hypothetical protein